MSDIIWTERKAGREFSVVKDLLVNIPVEVGSLIRVPLQFPDESLRGKALSVEEVEQIPCLNKKHTHKLKMYRLSEKVVVIEFSCVGEFLWGKSH